MNPIPAHSPMDYALNASPQIAQPTGSISQQLTQLNKFGFKRRLPMKWYLRYPQLLEQWAVDQNPDRNPTSYNHANKTKFNWRCTINPEHKSLPQTIHARINYYEFTGFFCAQCKNESAISRSHQGRFRAEAKKMDTGASSSSSSGPAGAGSANPIVSSQPAAIDNSMMDPAWANEYAKHWSALNPGNLSDYQQNDPRRFLWWCNRGHEPLLTINEIKQIGPKFCDTCNKVDLSVDKFKKVHWAPDLTQNPPL